MFEDITERLAADIEAFLASSVSESEEVSSDENNSIRKEARGTYFGMIIYPDEDPGHSALLNYVMIRPSYEKVWIRHDRDKKSDGSSEKPHVHLMVHTLERMTVGSFLKWFSPWIKYAECIHFPKSYVMYMLHDSPNSIADGKVPYSPTELQGDEKLWRHLIQNSHFVQLKEVLKYHEDGFTFLDTYNAIPLDRRPALGNFMQKYSYFVRQMIEDENRKYFRWLEWQGLKPYKPNNESEDD